MKLDQTDRSILYLVQKENRTELSTGDIAEQVGVSSSTVSNRLRRLRESGVIADYKPEIDYEKAGIPHHVLFVCTAPIGDLKRVATDALNTPNVVNVRELLSGTRNLLVEVVGVHATDVERVAEDLDALGIDIEASEIVREEYSRPLGYFGSQLSGE